MAENSGISWTDHTFNPWMGCTKVSAACKNCYAERDMDHRFKRVAWGPAGTRVLTSGKNWQQPIKWNREAGATGLRKRVFCASLADVFEDWYGPITHNKGNKLFTINGEEYFAESEYPECRLLTMNDVRHRLFRLIDATPHLDWLLLTKRPKNIIRMWQDVAGDYIPEAGMMNRPSHRSNVWIGTSVENQEYAEKRMPELLKCRDLAPVLFLSCEPLLGSVDLRSLPRIWCRACDRFEPDFAWNEPSPCFRWQTDTLAMIDWVIAGGESGPEARPSHPDWFRKLRDDCIHGGIPFHFKQWGEYASVSEVAGLGEHFKFEDATVRRVGTKAAGRTLDRVLHDAFPEVQHVV